MNLDSIRRAVRGKGLTPATVIPEASGGRAEEACIRLARIVEGDSLRMIPIGLGESWPGSLAYLDGVQRSEVIAYGGSAPIIAGEIAAGVRERRNRRLHTVVEARRVVAMGRPSVLAAAGDALEGLQLLPLPENEPPHPLRDLVNASHALDQARGALEVVVGDQYRVAHRSSIYAPATRSIAPVRAWGLRLWPWEGKDLLHGLIRVEVAPANGSTEPADEISRWILAERGPVSAPDRRWDRLLYGIYSVEQYLKAKA